MTRTDPTGRGLPHLRLACLMLAALLLSGTAGAATVTVNSTADPGDPEDEQCTLREAVAAINNGSDTGGCMANTDDSGYGMNDTIVFAPEAANETIQLDAGEGQITVSSQMTINGNDPESEDGVGPRVTVDANGTEDETSENESRIFQLNAATTLRNLFVAGGRVDNADGGAILINSGASLTAERLGISDSRATGTGRGGGIFIADGASITEFRNGAIGTSRAESGGGAIYDNSGAAGAVTIIGSTFNQNRAGVYTTEENDDGESETVPDTNADPADGGALYLPMGGQIVDEDGDSSNLSDNTATGSGGSIWTNGDTTIRNSLVLSSTAYGDEAGDGGGNIHAAANANLMLRLTTINNGEAVGENNGAGGGVLISGGNLNSDVSVFSANYAEIAGGGIALRDGATATLARTVLSANGAQDPNNEDSAVTPEGGALHADGAGDISLDGGGIDNNFADVSGGGIWSSDSNVTVAGTEVRSNNARGDAADNGGGAFHNGGTGTLTITESRLIGNNAIGDAGSGGVIFMAGGTLEISDSRFTRNSAERAGGAIEVTGGTVELTRVTLGGNDSGDGNLVGTNPGNGGAVHIGGGTVTVADSTIAYNTAVQGGGLWNGDGSTLTVRNSTISNNQATSSEDNNGDGGGLYQVAGGSTDLSFATVVRNTAENQGGGIAVGQDNADSVTASASIIAENTAANGNDFAEGDVALQGDGNVTEDAGLDGLQLFGGPTLTHPLVTDSPALDVASGCDTAPQDLDQRGAERPADGNGDGTADCDAGSFERTNDPVVSVSANGPQTVGASVGEDLLVLAFEVRNDSDQPITLDGFDTNAFLNNGYSALLGLLPVGFDPNDPLQFEVVEDADGDGQLDDGEAQVLGEDVNDRGRSFTFSGGLELSANESRDLLVVFRAPEVPEDDQEGAMQQATSGSKPLYAGGTALAMLGVFCLSGVRRRTRWLLALAVLVAGLTACSNADDAPPEDPAFIGDPELQGNIRFAVTELRGTTGTEGEILIGDGLPVYGPGIFTP